MVLWSVTAPRRLGRRKGIIDSISVWLLKVLFLGWQWHLPGNNKPPNLAVKPKILSKLRYSSITPVLGLMALTYRLAPGNLACLTVETPQFTWQLRSVQPCQVIISYYSYNVPVSSFEESMDGMMLPWPWQKNISWFFIASIAKMLNLHWSKNSLHMTNHQIPLTLVIFGQLHFFTQPLNILPLFNLTSPFLFAE